MPDNHTIELKYDEYVKIFKVLENLRLSLDRIGAINKQGRDKMRLAFDEYFTSEPLIYKEIADTSTILAMKIRETHGEEEVFKICRGIKHFELKKYD